MQKKPKYYYEKYWRNRISSGEFFSEGLFEGEPIRKGSIILAPTILNSYSNQMEDAWTVYPNIYSVLGFIQYMYLPTAYMGLLLKEKQEYRYYCQENFIHVDECWREKMKKPLTGHKPLRLTQGKRDSTSRMLFRSPLEAAEYIVQAYDEDLSVSMLEEGLEVTKDEFLKLAGEAIYSNDFMKRKFTDILTNRLILRI